MSTCGRCCSIPWRDGADRTRWAPPAFLPPSDDPGHWLINLEELPSAVPVVQAALYQLVLDRKVGEYELPEGASLIACGNRETDRGLVHRMPTPLASRFVHLEIRVDAEDWLAWGAANGIAADSTGCTSDSCSLRIHGDMAGFLSAYDTDSRERPPCPPPMSTKRCTSAEKNCARNWPTSGTCAKGRCRVATAGAATPAATARRKETADMVRTGR